MKTLYSFVALALSALFLPFTALAAGPATVNLSTAGNFLIISETGITDTGSHASVIGGNIGSSPITSAAMNGVFCSEVTGTIYGVDSAYVGSGSQACFAGNPPLSNKTLIDNAVLDMSTAYTDAAGRASPDGTELYAGNIGGHTFTPGLYKWSTDVNISTDIILSGGPTDIWIFQIAGNLNIASAGSVPSGIKVQVTGGALASNVFWQVGGVTGATLGTYSTFVGNILTAKQVIIQTGAVLRGRALAQTQVTLDANPVSTTTPAQYVVPPPVVTPTPVVVSMPSSLVYQSSNLSSNSTSTSNTNFTATSTATSTTSIATTTTTTTTTTATSSIIMITYDDHPTFPNTGFAPRQSGGFWSDIMSFFADLVLLP